MSKLDIIETEIARRRQEIETFKQAEEDLKATIEQFNKLDEFYRDQEKDSRELLECIYKEDRHFTGEWPIVYQFTDVEQRPYFKENDADCNPYFPISKVQDGTFDGIEPLPAPPTRTGAHQRQRSFAATEDIPRAAALTELQNFPDISNEPLPAGWPGPQTEEDVCSDPQYLDQATCELNGETWMEDVPVPDPVWNGPDTAPALLRVPLENWKTDIEAIIADLCNDDGGTEEAYWQGIIDDIDIVLDEIQDDAVFVRATGDSDPAAWGQTQPFTGAVEAARARLETAADTGVADHVSTRSGQLGQDATNEEDAFFNIIKLRLHQASGSYSKLEAAKAQQGQTSSFVSNNMDAIASLNLMKVKNS